MIHTYMPRSCTVFLLRRDSRRNTVGHFVESKCFLHKMTDRAEVFLWIIILLLKYFLTYAFHNQMVSNAFQRPTRRIHGKVFL